MVLRTSNNLNLGGAESGARALADLLAQAGRSTGEGYANAGAMLAGAGQMIGQRKIQRQARSDMLAQRDFENARQTKQDDRQAANDAFSKQQSEAASARAMNWANSGHHHRIGYSLIWRSSGKEPISWWFFPKDDPSCLTNNATPCSEH